MTRTAGVLALAALVLAGCQDPAPPPASGLRAAAVLASPTDVTVTWSGLDAAAAGAVVEFATDPGGPFTPLQFVPAVTRSYRHPDLMPQTAFYYRVRPWYGPVSATVDVTLPPGDFDEHAHDADPDWGAPRTRPEPGVSTSSVHFGSAAPEDLRASVADPNGIRFTWTDRASDEQGYLVEVRPAGSAQFRVAAVLDPDVNAYGLVTLPDEKRASYRVRAFYYGPPSNVVEETTGSGS